MYTKKINYRTHYNNDKYIYIFKNSTQLYFSLIHMYSQSFTIYAVLYNSVRKAKLITTLVWGQKNYEFGYNIFYILCMEPLCNYSCVKLAILFVCLNFFVILYAIHTILNRNFPSYTVQYIMQYLRQKPLSDWLFSPVFPPWHFCGHHHNKMSHRS